MVKADRLRPSIMMDPPFKRRRPMLHRRRTNNHMLHSKRCLLHLSKKHDGFIALSHSRHHNAGLAASPRKPCSAATTCAPSPIAPPTRLTDPERTSPTAKTPGTEGSSADADCPSFLLSCTPVNTKPARSTVTPQPSSQPVAGSAPTNRNRLWMSKMVS